MFKHKAIKYAVGILAVAFLAIASDITGERMWWIETVSAQTSRPLLDGVNAVLGTVVGLLITGIDLISWYLFLAIDVVLRPEFIFDRTGGQDGELLKMLHELWQLSRDLVNLIFAILLIVGAVITVITAKMDTVKSYFAKFVLAVVLVNFSWFIPRAVFDFSQVITHTVFEIPALLEEGGVATANDCKVRKPSATAGGGGAPVTEPCEVIAEVKFFEETNGITTGGTSSWKCPIADIVCYRSETYGSSTASMPSKVINGLILNHAHLKDLTNPTLSGPATGGFFSVFIRTFMRLFIVLIIHIALFFPLLALAIAFFIRIPILWITMAFMPFVALGYVINIPQFNPIEKIWKRFLSAAFLPAIAGVPLTIGFIMLNASMLITEPTAAPAAGGTSSIINPSIPLFAGVSTLWQLIWLVLALMVMWAGVFGVLKNQEFIGGIVGQIESVGKSIGSLAMKWPMSWPMPFLPRIGGEKSSFLKMGQALYPPNLLRNVKATGEFPWQNKDQSGNLPQRIATAMKTNPGKVMNHIQVDITNITNATTPEQRISGMENILKTYRQKMANSGVENAPDDQVVEAIIHNNPSSEAKLRAAFQELQSSKTPKPSTPPPTTP